jgi:hypothetical protein
LNTFSRTPDVSRNFSPSNMSWIFSRHSECQMSNVKCHCTATHMIFCVI